MNLSRKQSRQLFQILKDEFTIEDMWCFCYDYGSPIYTLPVTISPEKMLWKLIDEATETQNFTALLNWLKTHNRMVYEDFIIEVEAEADPPVNIPPESLEKTSPPAKTSTVPLNQSKPSAREQAELKEIVKTVPAFQSLNPDVRRAMLVACQVDQLFQNNPSFYNSGTAEFVSQLVAKLSQTWLPTEDGKKQIALALFLTHLLYQVNELDDDDRLFLANYINQLQAQPPPTSARARIDDISALLAATHNNPHQTQEDTRSVFGRRRHGTTPSLGPIRQRWAFLVGINHYVDPTFKRLNFCVNDVVALEQVLTQLGYIVVALHDNASEERLKPTKENIEAELLSLCQTTQPDDLIWVHGACHGLLVDNQPILVARNSRRATITRSGLALSEVEKTLCHSQAKRKVMTLDACHVGVELGRDVADPAFIRNVHELAEGFALIAASTAQQVAQEWRAKKHGVFTYYLLEALTNKTLQTKNGFITVADLSHYVLNQLRIWRVQHGGITQDPTARIEGIGDMIVADFRKEG